jgi:hypothetical protein
MALAYDSASGLQSNSGTVHTLSHTCSGSNRLLVVYVMISNARSIVSITYGGVDMTLKTSKIVGQSVYVYYLAAPATGANNVVVTIDSSSYCYPTAVSYTGVDQSTPTGNAGTSNGTTPSITLTTTVANAWLVMGVRDAVDGATNAGTDTTRRWANDTQGYDRTTTTTGSYAIAATGCSAGDDCALAGMVINPNLVPDASTIYLKGRPRNRYDFTGISLG